MEQMYSELPAGWSRVEVVETRQDSQGWLWSRWDMLWLAIVVTPVALLVVWHLLFVKPEPDARLPMPQAKAALLQLCQTTTAPQRRRTVSADSVYLPFSIPTPPATRESGYPPTWYGPNLPAPRTVP